MYVVEASRNKMIPRTREETTNLNYNVCIKKDEILYENSNMVTSIYFWGALHVFHIKMLENDGHAQHYNSGPHGLKVAALNP